jgi:hypothetical protein
MARRSAASETTVISARRRECACSECGVVGERRASPSTNVQGYDSNSDGINRTSSTNIVLWSWLDSGLFSKSQKKILTTTDDVT